DGPRKEECPMEWPTPTLADVLRARAAIAPYLTPTPTLEPAALGEALGCRAYLKCENLTPTGAFKVRGGVNLLAALTPEERARGASLRPLGQRAAADRRGGHLRARTPGGRARPRRDLRAGRRGQRCARHRDGGAGGQPGHPHHRGAGGGGAGGLPLLEGGAAGRDGHHRHLRGGAGDATAVRAAAAAPAEAGGRDHAGRRRGADRGDPAAA